MKPITDLLRDLTGPDSPVSEDAQKAITEGLSCRWCRETYRDGRPAHFASDPRCAFDERGVFHSDNWQCAGMSPLREAAYDREVWSDDQHCSIVPLNGCRFIVISYYKHRGRTEGAWVVSADTVEPLTTKHVEHFHSGAEEEYEGLPLGWTDDEVVEP